MGFSGASWLPLGIRFKLCVDDIVISKWQLGLAKHILKSDDELCAFTRLAFYLDGAAQRFYLRLCDKEAHALAVVARVKGLIQLEEFTAIFCQIYSQAIVFRTFFIRQ